MKDRRNFLKSSALATAGAFTFANIAGCGSNADEKQIETQSHLHPLGKVTRENIKITDVKVTPFSYVDPGGNLWRHNKYMVWKADGCLTQIFTDQGIVGIGEGTPYGGPDRIKKYTDEIIKPKLIGKNPFDVEFIACGGTQWNVSNPPWAGVDCALWDIIGKAKNMPVYKLLAIDNEPDPHILVYASAGVEHEWYNKGDEFLINEALRYKEQGFSAFKFRTGTDWEYSGMTLEKYIPVLRRLRDAVGPDFKLMHETMGTTGVSLEQIIDQFCPVLEELKFHWFEHPLGDIDSFIKINEALPTVKVSAGEMQKNRFEVKEWIDRGAYDIVQTDCNTTGITENWHISRMANLNGMLHCPHSWHGGLTAMPNAHLVAAIPNRHMLEQNQTFSPLKYEIFKDPVLVKNGYMDLTDKPGLGVEVIDDLEKKFPFAPGDFKKPNPLMTN